MNAAMLMLVASTMTAPQPATTSELSASPSFTVGHNVTFVSEASDIQAAKPAAPAQKPSPTHQMAGKSVSIFIQGGILFASSSTGFTIGAGAAFVPMKDHQQFEINADVMYFHIYSTNGWDLSFNGQYNFKMQNSKMTPFVDGGLIIASFNYGTNPALQIGGGIEAAMSSGRAFRVQIRVGFLPATATQILFGFAF
jgi:hypothetical protein